MSERVPIGDALSGLTIHDLDEGETVVGAFILLKVLDAEGDVTWSFRNTESSTNREELLGALSVQVELLKHSLVDDWDVD